MAGLCSVIDREELIEDPRFLTNHERFANRFALWSILEPAFFAGEAAVWVEKLEREGIPVGVVNTLDRVMADPQIQHRGMVTELVSEDGQAINVMGNPLHFAEATEIDHQYPPALGQDTRAIMRELLGVGDDELDRLIDGKVLGVATRAPVAA